MKVVKTPEEMEEDYQLGLELQRIGFLRTDWKLKPENLAGNRMLLKYLKKKEVTKK